MSDQPLTSGEQGKIIFFFISLIPLVMLFGIGVVFVGIFLFCAYLTRKNNSTSPLEGAIKSFKVVMLVAAVGFMLMFFIRQVSHEPYFEKWYQDTYVMVPFFASIVFFMYFFLSGFLFLDPIQRHREWVSKNGIFSSKDSSGGARNPEGAPSIMKHEKLASYSVADELIKWKKLRDEGLVSDDEYQKARKKLLGG